MAILIDNNPITSNGDYEIYWRGGDGVFGVDGTPDGATIKLQRPSISSAGSYVDLGSYTEFVDTTGNGAFSWPAGYLNVNVASGGGSLSVGITLAQK